MHKILCSSPENSTNTTDNFRLLSLQCMVINRDFERSSNFLTLILKFEFEFKFNWRTFSIWILIKLCLHVVMTGSICVACVWNIAERVTELLLFQKWRHVVYVSDKLILKNINDINVCRYLIQNFAWNRVICRSSNYHAKCVSFAVVDGNLVTQGSQILPQA